MDPPLLLVTGFGPFTGCAENPSGAVACALPGLHSEALGGARILGRELPVTFAGAPPALEAFLEDAPGPPAALLGLGVQCGNWWRLESRAGSRLTSAKPDNDGVSGADVVVPREVAGTRWTSLELEPLATALRAAGAGDVRVSEVAGGFVCEWVYRHLLAHGERLGVPALFVHVPPAADVAVARQTQLVARLAKAVVAQLAAR